MNKIPRRILVTVGVACLILSAAGIWYNSGYLLKDYSGMFEEYNTVAADLSYFYVALYVLSGICVTFYVLLAITGIQLIKLKTQWAFMLLSIIIAEVVYYIILGYMWQHPEYGFSIAAASGVSSGGLVFQVFILFPIWAPAAALWARNRLHKSA